METRTKTPSEVLIEAAAIVRRGWCQGTTVDFRGNVCALGALGVARSGAATRWTSQDRELLREAVPAIGVSAWNDAPGQTAENVALTMERAAYLPFARNTAYALSTNHGRNL